MKKLILPVVLLFLLILFVISFSKPRAKQQHVPTEVFKPKIPGTLEEKLESLQVTKGPYQVISFALYGNNPRYTVGATKNAELAKQFYPGWVCRFYHDNTVPKELLDQLLAMGGELVNVDNTGVGKELGGMFWRFLVALDHKVDRYIVRDIDSRLGPREVAAVKEWIESGYPVHSMRDHPNHNYPLNGGMWGAVRGGIPNFLETVKEWKGKSEYMEDMYFLGTFWPAIKDKTLSHDSRFCDKYPNCRNFPTPLSNPEDHVGSVPGWA